VNREQEADFERFALGAASRLLRTAYLLVGDRGHAEDLVQIALERTARKWTRLDGPPEAYARTVLVNAATDRWRRRRTRVREVSVELPDHGSDDGTTALASRLALIEALRRLPPRQRAVLVLRFFDDLTEADTAKALEISVGTVKSTTSRGLARLREIVPNLPEESHP
jgi:RNA polymerase sigma-70 factor (sigma-E family)